MKNPICDEISTKLVDYVDGELSPEQVHTIEGHLASCAHCRKLIKALNQSLSIAQGLWEGAYQKAGQIPLPKHALEPISKLVLQRDRAKSLWARPEVKRARRRTEVRREPFLPTTQSHELCSRSQPKGVLKWVLSKARSWMRYAAVAAVIAVLLGVLWQIPQRPQEAQLSLAQVEEQVRQSARAAQLLVATRMLSECQGTEELVQQQLQYIQTQYSEVPGTHTIDIETKL